MQLFCIRYCFIGFGKWIFVEPIKYRNLHIIQSAMMSPTYWKIEMEIEVWVRTCWRRRDRERARENEWVRVEKCKPRAKEIKGKRWIKEWRLWNIHLWWKLIDCGHTRVCVCIAYCFSPFDHNIFPFCDYDCDCDCNRYRMRNIYSFEGNHSSAAAKNGVAFTCNLCVCVCVPSKHKWWKANKERAEVKREKSTYMYIRWQAKIKI